jgi:predicted Zn-dependent peptidase
MLKKIKSVTAEDLQKIAQEFFVPNNLNLAIVGPELDQTEIKKNIDV